MSVLNHPALGDTGLVEVEQSVFGFDHALLGGRITRNWRLPEEICRIITFHHKPMGLVESNRMLTAIVYLSDLICNARKIGYVPTKKAESKEINTILESINLTKEDLPGIVQKLTLDMENSKDLFLAEH